MNRYPLWKYLVIAVALVVGILYTLPNFFPEVPAVQVSSSKATVKIDTALLAHGRGRAQGRGDSLPRRGARRDRHQGPLRRPRHAAEGEGRAAGEARRQLHRRAEPAVGVAAVADGDRRAADVPRPRPARRRALPAAGRHEGGARQGRRPLHDRHPLAAAREEGPVRAASRAKAPTSSSASATKPSAPRRASRSRRAFPDLAAARGRRRAAASCGSSRALKPEAQKRIQDGAVQQNITILRNRVNELGVAEPIVQQQGADRVVVQLPGVQDTARAKDILGRTATLEIRMVNDEPGRARSGARRPACRSAATSSPSAAARRSSSGGRWC